jgi:predicted amidophosphoribosyltransferase
MCGCMLMHATMDHQGHQPDTQSAPMPAGNAMPATSGQRCAHCGFSLQNDFVFCPHCGISLRTAVCSACGQKVDPNWTTCAYCGSPLSEVQGQPAHN